MQQNRRIFLRNSALAMVGVGSVPLWLERALYAADAPSPRKKILVAIFQRGAADGLNIVVPHGEKAYYNARPQIGIPENKVIKLSKAEVGLHPSMKPIAEMYDSGLCTIVQGVGYPNPDRSHFEAMDIWQSADPKRLVRTGWLGRGAAEFKGGKDEPAGPYLLVVTQKGLSLRTPLAPYKVPSTKNGRMYVKLNDGDRVVMVHVLRDGDKSLFLVSRDGHVLHFAIEEINLIAGVGKGVIGIKLEDDDA